MHYVTIVVVIVVFFTISSLYFLKIYSSIRLSKPQVRNKLSVFLPDSNK